MCSGHNWGNFTSQSQGKGIGPEIMDSLSIVKNIVNTGQKFYFLIFPNFCCLRSICTTSTITAERDDNWIRSCRTALLMLSTREPGWHEVQQLLIWMYQTMDDNNNYRRKANMFTLDNCLRWCPMVRTTRPARQRSQRMLGYRARVRCNSGALALVTSTLPWRDRGAFQKMLECV